MTNAEIAKLLRNVAASYAITNEKKFRFQIIAYQKAADALENSPTEANDLLKEDKLEDLPGIGPSIRQHIDDLLTKGRVKQFEWITKDIPDAVFPLLDVPSFGPKKAYKLVTTFKLKNPDTVLDDLETAAQKGKIATLEGFGEKSQQDILQAIAEYRLGKSKTRRMALPYASDLAQKMLIYLKKSKDVIQVYPLGSFRRKMSTIGDIDFAVATNQPKEVLKHFLAYPYKERVIEQGDTSASMLISSGRQVDLMTMPPDSFGSLLQHFTGSKNHNVRLREYALKKGLSLSEYGIKKHGKIQKYDSEERFYEALGMSWIPPELREDHGEIELALKHRLPKLVELRDIKGDLHIHSSFPIEPSHDMGKDEMENMQEYAEKLGYEYVGFSEHNPSVSKHTKEQVHELLKRKKEKIDQINSSTENVRVINLLETDILANGDLAIDKKAFDYLDAALVSIHSVFSMDKEAMTERILKGLSHPKAKILSHPTGRLINSRPGYEIDFDTIFDFCVKNNKAIEINAWPTRLDLPDIMVKKAIEHNVKLVINTDSHATWQMDMMQHGVSVARRGWATKGDILNALPYEDFIKWLKGGDK